MSFNIFVKTQLQKLKGQGRKETRLGGTFCCALYSSEIPAVKQLDTQLICSNMFIKTQLQKLKGERKEKRLGGTFCGAFYSSEIAENKH
jgi:hypothetical protein